MRQASKTIGLGLALLLAAGGAFAQVSFSKYVALGDSYAAGYSNNSLVQTHQINSYPAILAGQFGITGFELPLISEPGIPGEYELKALHVVNGSVVPVITPKDGQGQPINAQLARPYDDLGIPGARVNDLVTKTGDITKLITGNIDPNTLMYDIVLRDGQHTALEQAIGLQGSFYTVWIGGNDVLNGVLAGVVVDGVTLTPTASFQSDYTTLLGAIRSQLPNAAIVVANLGDVTALPYVTAVKPYLVNPANGSHIPLIGEAGLITEDDYLTLQAAPLIQQGIGVPVAAGGTGLPLPEGKIDQTGLHAGVILRKSEVDQVRARTAEINAVIAAVAAQVGAKVVDVNPLWSSLVAGTYVVGGVKVTASFLTGGMFGYDGFHPSDLGYAIIANEFIRVINADYGTEVPEVNLRPYLLGAQAATTVLANQALFTHEAGVAMLHAMVPNVQTDTLDVPVHRPVRRILQREAPEAQGRPSIH
ncbi:MAG: SGNH/GDSL hydrolase family protein [Acidobacteriota bacterium]